MAAHYRAPGWFTKNVFNRLVAFSTRHGLSVLGSRVLAVRGRSSGEWRTTPVNLLEVEHRQYLVSPRGETQWVRNLRVAGAGELRVGKKTEPFRARELGDEEKVPMLPRLPQALEDRGRHLLRGGRAGRHRRGAAGDRTSPSGLRGPSAGLMRGGPASARAAGDRSGRLGRVRPLDLGPRANDEYEPLPPSPAVVEAARRARAAMHDLVRSGAVSRRDLLRSAAASAAVLSALAACAGEERSSAGRPEPGGTFDVPGSRATSAASTERTIDPAAASTVLDRDDPVMDVQLHFLDPDRNTGGFGSGFPQASCGGPDPRLCFSQDVFLDLVFAQSDTEVGVLSGLPIAGRDAPLALDVMERARERLAQQGGNHRLLLQAPVFPATGPLGSALDGMAADADTYPVAAWKTYTHSPDAYRLDDERGDALLAQAVALGRPIVAVHKGISGGAAAASPADVGPAAAAHPDATIVVYHSGWEPGGAEGPFVPATSAEQLHGVDRLLASLQTAGVGPGGNVYAELGSTWFNLARDPDAAAHVLGKLLVHLGPERILWGTDSIWYGSPQGQIDAFRAFEIGARFQDEYGYPPLTNETKQLVLGGNARRLYGLS